MSTRVFLEEYTGHSTQESPFRSYYLVSDGETEEELIDHAVLFSIDQDGGSAGSIELGDARQEVFEYCLKRFKQALQEARI
jgi:hypothetical protein